MKKKYIKIFSSFLILLLLCILGIFFFKKDNIDIKNENFNTEVVEKEQEEQEENDITVTEDIQQEEEKEEIPQVQTQPQEVSQDYQGGFIGYLTHYGPDCIGCSGITASGYDVRNTIYYEDNECGTLRIIALSKNYPLYTVVRMNNYKGGEIYAIVLDRGGAITGDRIDLLVSSEAEAEQLGVQDGVTVNIMR